MKPASAELALTLFTVVLLGAPVMMYVFWQLGLPVASYRFFALLPALILLLVIGVYSKYRFQRLANRLVIGLLAGALAALALPIFFATKAAAEIASLGMVAVLAPPNPPPEDIAITPAIVAVGLLYHFLDGAGFGAVYTLIMGKAKWYYGMAWGAIIVLGITVTVARFTVGFGTLLSLIDHLIFGAVLGLLAQRFVKEPGTLLSLAKGAS